MPDLSPEAREALKIAESVNGHIHVNDSWCRSCKEIAAALLEAEARGMWRARFETTSYRCRDEMNHLHHEAQVLREGSK